MAPGNRIMKNISKDMFYKDNSIKILYFKLHHLGKAMCKYIYSQLRHPKRKKYIYSMRISLTTPTPPKPELNTTFQKTTLSEDIK